MYKDVLQNFQKYVLIQILLQLYQRRTPYIFMSHEVVLGSEVHGHGDENKRPTCNPTCFTSLLSA